MHKTFDFCLSTEFEEYTIDLADFTLPKTAKCLEEITFVFKPASFADENCLKVLLEIKKLEIV